MSLTEEVHFRPDKGYCDFADGEHSIAVFGLAASALRYEVEVELEETLSLDSDNTDY